jgi:hypothetical protein
MLLLCACAWACSDAGWADALQAPVGALAERMDMVVNISRRGAAGDEEGLVKGVELEGEAANEDWSRAFGFRSMRQVVDVDCTSRRERVAQMQVFDQHGQRGRAAMRRPPGQWAQPSPDAYLADVIAVVCKGGRLPGRQVALAAARPPAPLLPDRSEPTVSTSPAPPPGPHGTEPPARPTGRRALADAARPRPAPSRSAPAGPVLSAAPAVASPNARPTIIKAANPPKPAAPVRAASLAAVALVTPAASPLRPAVQPRSWVAQVGASSSEAGAKRALDGLGSLIGANLAGRVEAATVRGQLYYRSTVAGFSTHAEADAFCARAARTGRACWTR